MNDCIMSKQDSNYEVPYGFNHRIPSTQLVLSGLFFTLDVSVVNANLTYMSVRNSISNGTSQCRTSS